MSKAPRIQCATTFRADEVQALAQLFGILLRGGDTDEVMMSKPMARVVSKFQRMQRKLERGG